MATSFTSFKNIDNGANQISIKFKIHHHCNVEKDIAQQLPNSSKAKNKIEQI